jgi:hypothetical protein
VCQPESSPKCQLAAPAIATPVTASRHLLTVVGLHHLDFIHRFAPPSTTGPTAPSPTTDSDQKELRSHQLDPLADHHLERLKHHSNQLLQLDCRLVLVQCRQRDLRE